VNLGRGDTRIVSVYDEI